MIMIDIKPLSQTEIDEAFKRMIQEQEIRIKCLDFASRVGPGYDHLELANRYFHWVKTGIFIPYSERPCS